MSFHSYEDCIAAYHVFVPFLLMFGKLCAKAAEIVSEGKWGQGTA